MTVSEKNNLQDKYCNAHEKRNVTFRKIAGTPLLLILFTVLLLILSGCIFNFSKSDNNTKPVINIKSPNDEEDFITFSLAADKRLLAVHYVNTPNKLKEYGIKPVTIKTKKQLEDYLKQYWSYIFIDKKWREGADKMPGKPFGFTVKDTGFLSASDVKYEKLTESRVLISGKVSDPTVENKFKIRIMTIEKTKSGWRATGIQYKDLTIQ